MAYPTSLDTFLSAVSKFSTKPLTVTLNGLHDATVTTLTFNEDPAVRGLAATKGLLRCEDEDIFYTTRTGMTVTGCTRAYGGTTAAAHNSGVECSARIGHEFVSELQTAVLAVETELGASGSRKYLRIVDAVAQTIDGVKTFTGAVRFGTNPALTGLLGLSNNSGIYGRNAANNADKLLAKVNASDQIELSAAGVDTKVAGKLLLSADPTDALGAASKQMVDLKIGTGGGTLTGFLTLHADPTAALHAASKQYTDLKLLKAGDTMTGNLRVNASLGINVAPLAPLHVLGQELRQQTDNGFLSFYNTAGTQRFGYIQVNKDGEMTILQDQAQPIRFYTLATLRLTLDNAGALIPAVTGNDLGSSALRWDALIQDIDAEKNAANYRWLQKNSATGATSNDAGSEFYLKNASGTSKLYAGIYTTSAVITAGSERSTVSLLGMSAGSNYTFLSAWGRDLEIGLNNAQPLARLHVHQNSLGTEVFRLESEATNDNPNNRTFHARAVTTDAAITQLMAHGLTAGNTYLIEARVLARRTGGTAGTAEDGAGYVIRGTFKTVGGAATLIGAVQASYTAEDQAGWNATMDTTTTFVRVLVTGAVDNNITWHCTLIVSNVGT